MTTTIGAGAASIGSRAAARHAWFAELEVVAGAHHGVVRTEHLAHVPRRAVQAAVSQGVLTRVARGVFALPGTELTRIEAARHTGVASHLSAAVLHGWKVAKEPATVHVTVPQGRRIRNPFRSGRKVTIHYADLTPEERRAGITSPVRTVLDCARVLPFPEALAVADSALRAGNVSAHRLNAEADLLRGPGSAAARRVARHANALADNPFESALRGICTDVPGLEVTPQVQVTTPNLQARVDLAHNLVIEADSYGFHSSPAAMNRDLHRYCELVSQGWTVLRFTWQQVFNDPQWIMSVLRNTLAARPAPRQRRAKRTG